MSRKWKKDRHYNSDRKRTKGQITIYKKLCRGLMIQRTPLKTGGELRTDTTIATEKGQKDK
jgi:hypothetical protein